MFTPRLSSREGGSALHAQVVCLRASGRFQEGRQEEFLPVAAEEQRGKVLLGESSLNVICIPSLN